MVPINFPFTDDKGRWKRVFSAKGPWTAGPAGTGSELIGPSTGNIKTKSLPIGCGEIDQVIYINDQCTAISYFAS